MLDRRSFLLSALPAALDAQPRPGSLRRLTGDRPRAITMWDFSWLERRWPGAGYEDWDLALDQLAARGYNAVRIDAYPHLIHYGARKTWELLPQWSVQVWGAPARCRVQVQPALNQFIRKCGERNIVVGLSTWFREDIDKHRLKLTAPSLLTAIWKSTLDSIAADGLLKHIYYVDLCNEWPLDVWAPFYPIGLKRATPEGARWMREPIEALRRHYPDLDYTFSFTSEYDTWRQEDNTMLDFLELHLWMTHFSDFYKRVGYNYERFDIKGYDNLALHAEKLYRSDPRHWQSRLLHGIDHIAEWAKTKRKPLVTTECWSLVDYKDFPLLPWDYLIELCEIGVRHAAAKRQWAAIATSNFCGPQFVGMWRELDWHRRMTTLIKGSGIDWPS